MSKQKKNPKPLSTPKTPTEKVETRAMFAQTKQQWLTWAGLFVLTMILFSAGFANNFVEWDDQVYIRDNYLVNQPSWAHVFKSFRTGVALNYHPLTIVSLIFNAGIWGFDKPSSFIVTNAIIHALNVCLVYVFVYRLSEKKYWVALITALLFAVHPMRVESVTWASERKDVLYTFFFIWGLIQYLQFKDTNVRKHLIYSLILFVCSCLSKGQAVCFPGVLVLIDYWQRGAFSVKDITDKWAFWGVALLFGAIALSIQSGGNFYGLTQTVGEQKTALDLNVFKAQDRLIYAGYGFMMYIVKLVYPRMLSPFYPYQLYETPDGQMYYYGLPFFLIVAVITLLSIRKTRVLAFGVGFYFATVALVLQFISVGTAIMAERYSYLPYLGLFFAIAWGLNILIEKYENLKMPILGATGLIIVGLCYLTHEQIKIWHDEGQLFGRMIEAFPNDHRPYGIRGLYIGKKGDLEGGIRDLERSIGLGSKETSTFHNLGVAYGIKGNNAKAIAMFTKAIELGSKDGNTYANRAIGYLPTNPAQAIIDFEQALKLSPPEKEAEIRGNLGLAYTKVGRYAEAVPNFEKSIALGMRNANFFINNGYAKMQIGNPTCVKDFEETLKLDPTNAFAKEQLAKYK